MNFSLHTLSPKVRRKAKKIVGRGNSAGGGTTAGRGTKGQKARSGGSIPAGFEGGRTTLIMQTPKMRGKGFKSLKPDFYPVEVSDLNVFSDGEKVTAKSLRAKGLVRGGPVKILSGGKLSKKLEVALPASRSARAAIEAAGGSVVEAKKPAKS